MAPASVPDSCTALATIVESTVSRSSVEFTACETSLSARSSATDWKSSRERACTSSNSRSFSIAITAWRAKVVNSAICLSANGLVLPQQGNGENGPVAVVARVRAAIGELVGGGLEVVYVDRFPINEGAPSDPAAPDRRTDKIHWDRAVMSSDTKQFTLT